MDKFYNILGKVVITLVVGFILFTLTAVTIQAFSDLTLLNRVF